jgi:hypothetical protein
MSHPALTLLLCNSFPEVMTDHGNVAAMLSAVFCRPPQNFTDELGNVLKVSRVYVSEERF